MLPIIHQVCGVILVIIGAIVLPLPIPLGLIMLTVGFALLAPYVPAVQRLVRHIRTKWPSVNEKLLKYRNSMPEIVKSTIDKTHPPQSPAE